MTVYIETGRDNQANVEKFLETGDKAYLNHFTDDNPSGLRVRVGGSGIPITFLTACRDNGLHIICHDISDAQHAEELDTIPLSLAGDAQTRLKALKARIEQVGEEQTNKEASQFYERRRQHNEDWMEVFTETQCATGGRFLFIGGEGHFNNNIGENSDRPDIDELIAKCGYNAPHVCIELHDGYKPYIEKPTTRRKWENDLPGYRVFYNKQQFGVIPNWTHELAQSQLESGQLNYPQYQHRLAMFAEHHEKLLAGINAAEKILVVPESDAWQKLPEYHPMKSSEHVEKAQPLFKKLTPLKTALVEGKADYDQAQKLFEELRVQSQRYRADAEKLKTYYEDHISANPQSRFDRPIFDHLSLVLAADEGLKDAETSNWFLASYKLDFDNKKKANAKGSSTMP